jgi:oligopeptide/dipeptide ABC transporter ATP-binding protein
VILAGRDLTTMAPEELRRARIAMQPVFQDSTAAFNPRRSVFNILVEAMTYGMGNVQDQRAEAIALLKRVGLAGESLLDRYHHELSGGQRQRLGIARALAARPRLLIADEPLSGADVSIRGQLLNLLLDLCRTEGLAILFITHDISIAEVFANRVLVMYRGAIVEEGPAADVLAKPAHPYTRLLNAAVPSIDSGYVAVRELLVTREAGKGCAFHGRCASAVARCSSEVPQFGAWAGARRARCFVAHEAHLLPGSDSAAAGAQATAPATAANVAAEAA